MKLPTVDLYPQYNNSICDHPDGNYSSCMTAIQPADVIAAIDRVTAYMPTRRAFVVLGCESSGTKWLTGIMASAGADGDGNQHEQRWDMGLKDAPDVIVWRRSLPFGHHWISLEDELLAPLRARHYAPIVIHLHRRPDCTAKSQVAAGHAPDECTALSNIARADQLITDFATLHCLPHHHVSYEDIVAYPASLVPLLAAWGLRLDSIPDVVDGNAKWLESANGPKRQAINS